MTRNLKRVLILTAGVLTFGAAATYGQNKVVTDITFPFATKAGIMPAGTYTVQKVNQGAGIPIVLLRNEQTNESTLLVAGRLESNDVKPKLVFNCIDSACSLAKIWLGNGSGFEFMQPHLTPAQKENLATVKVPARQGQ